MKETTSREADKDVQSRDSSTSLKSRGDLSDHEPKNAPFVRSRHEFVLSGSSSRYIPMVVVSVSLVIVLVALLWGYFVF